MKTPEASQMLRFIQATPPAENHYLDVGESRGSLAPITPLRGLRLPALNASEGEAKMGERPELQYPGATGNGSPPGPNGQPATQLNLRCRELKDALREHLILVESDLSEDSEAGPRWRANGKRLKRAATSVAAMPALDLTEFYRKLEVLLEWAETVEPDDVLASRLSRDLLSEGRAIIRGHLDNLPAPIPSVTPAPSRSDVRSSHSLGLSTLLTEAGRSGWRRSRA